MSNQDKNITKNTRQALKFNFCAPLVFLLLAAFTPVIIAAPPGDLVIPRQEGAGSTEFMPPSIFPHWIHRIRYRCDACHDSLFKMELGATDITMEQMGIGQSCGVCHDGETAFETGFENCERCHDLPVE